MEVTVSREGLFDCLSTIMNVVPQRSVKPLLTNVFLETKDEKLTIFGTDFEVTLEGTIEPIEIANPGALGVNGKKFYDLLRELTGTGINLKQEGQRLVMRQTDNKGRFVFPIITGEEFPSLPKIDSVRATVRARADVMLKMLSHTSYATSPDISMISFTGILWQIKPEEYRMVATDGHRLALFCDRTAPKSDLELDLLISKRSMENLARVFVKSKDEEFSAIIGDTRVSFTIGNYSFTTNLIGERFPNYEQVLPRDNDKILELQRDDLVNALRRVAIFSSPLTHMVRFSMEKDSLKLSAVDPETGGEAEEIIQANYEGEPMDIGFSANDIIDILRHIETERVKITFRSPLSAAMIYPARTSENEEYLAVLMPLRLPEE
jgi:DNA polymerase-3 subunit beta